MGLCEPPLAVVAEYFESEAQTGRNKALLLAVRDAEGRPHRSFVKVDARLTIPPTEHLLEWLASALARRLGLDTPPPLAVQIGLPFASAIQDREVALACARSVGLCFGSEHVGPGFTQWKADDQLPIELREQAAELLVFDVLIHNFDRRRENPNVLANRRRVVAIDHGDAFGFLFPPLVADPAVDSLVRLRDQHVFGRSFSARMVLSLDRVRDAIAALDDAFLEALQAATPPEWTRGLAVGRLEQVLSMMRQRRDAVDVWFPEVNAWMRT